MSFVEHFKKCSIDFEMVKQGDRTFGYVVKCEWLLL